MAIIIIVHCHNLSHAHSQFDLIVLGIRYMTEVGDQRREIEGLRSQLGAAHATSVLSSTRRMMDDGSLHSSVLAS